MSLFRYGPTRRYPEIPVRGVKAACFMQNIMYWEHPCTQPREVEEVTQEGIRGKVCEVSTKVPRRRETRLLNTVAALGPRWVFFLLLETRGKMGPRSSSSSRQGAK